MLRISTIRLITSNLSLSRKFMVELFSLDLIYEDDRFSSYQLKDQILDLILEDKKNPASFGGCIAYFKVDNLDKLVVRAMDLGGHIYRGPLLVNETKQTIVQIKDPSGLIIGLEENL